MSELAQQCDGDFDVDVPIDCIRLLLAYIAELKVEIEAIRRDRALLELESLVGEALRYCLQNRVSSVDGQLNVPITAEMPPAHLYPILLQYVGSK